MNKIECECAFSDTFTSMLIYKCFVLFVENIQEANKQHRNVLCNFKIEKEISKVRTQDSWTRKSGLSGSWFPFGNLAADQSSCVCLSAYLCIFVSVRPISCNQYFLTDTDIGNTIPIPIISFSWISHRYRYQ